MTHVPFAYEADLYDVLAQHLPSVLVGGAPPTNTRTFRQRAVGMVIPDLIYVRAYHDAKPVLPARGLTTVEAAIVAALLGGRRLRDATIARRLYTNVDRIAPRLRALERRGIIKERTDGVWILRRRTMLNRTRVVAVEAKLHRWGEAIEQAVSYLAFANQSYVALPRAIALKNEKIERACRKARVGLMLVEPGNVRLSLKAPQHHPRTADRVWLLARTMPHMTPRCS